MDGSVAVNLNPSILYVLTNREKKNPSPPTSNVPNVSKHRRDFLINFKYCINGNEEKYLFGS